MNTCSELDWPRALASHLWYITHPLSSVWDALHDFELAWRGTGPHAPYCSAPAPAYLEEQVVIGQPALATDLKYQLLRLYCDKSTAIEQLVDPSSPTWDRLDSRLGWLGQGWWRCWDTGTWLTMPGTGCTGTQPARLRWLGCGSGSSSYSSTLRMFGGAGRLWRRAGQEY